MKQELPFAVALLAAGCLLCFSQFSGPAESSARSESDSVQSTESSQTPPNELTSGVENSPPLDAGNLDNHGPLEVGVAGEFNAVVPASYQAGVSDQMPRSLPSEGNSLNRLPLNPDLYFHQDSNPHAISFLAELSKKVSQSQPIGASIELTGNLFGQVVSASGDYYQMGQGSHKSRIELSFATLANSPSVIQLCDGRFVYKFQSSGDQRELEFVDLLRVREKAGERGSGITPTGWVASGGIASLFQHLASAFNFGEIEYGDDSSVTLRGSWDDAALRQIVGVENDPDNPVEGRTSRWSQVPGQLPHAVELVFRHDKDLDYFPRRIKFLRVEASSQDTKLSPMVVLEFSVPRPLPGSSSRYFVVEATDLDSVDMTQQYIARIEDFRRLEQTAESNATIDR